MVDLSLYLVTDPGMTAARGLVATVVAAVQGGVSLVQIRDKHASPEQVRGQVERLRAAGVGVPIVVNDSVEGALGADGVHLGQDDGDPVAARRELGESAIIGLSVTTPGQVRSALELPAGTLDYLGVGPVWPTATKQDHAPALGVAGVTEMVQLAGELPCVAIGGIGPGERLASLRTTGVAGICVVSAICAADDPREAAERLRQEWAER